MIEQSTTAFVGGSVLHSGALLDVACVVKELMQEGAEHGAILVFDDNTGRVVDLDLRGSTEDIAARLHLNRSSTMHGVRNRGRPKLGVTAREVTLLPRHWEWLAAQRGGASAAIRRLVDDAIKTELNETFNSLHVNTAYRFMSAIAGDYPQFEEASRALFASDIHAFRQHVSLWPDDVRCYLFKLLHIN